MRWLVLMCVATAVVFAQDAKVARGKYLLEEVAKCQDCHTPKMDNGDFIKSQWMKGAALAFTPVSQPPTWKAKAPDVTANSAVMKRWGLDGMIKFLETGKSPRGTKASPPMPNYVLSHDDAEAIALFLNSIQ